MSVQPRVPEGVPTGGQFSTPTHKEPEQSVRLFDRTDCTYLHPTPFRTAEKCIEFWSTVEIPDAIVDQAVAAYEKSLDAEVDRRIEAVMEAFHREWFTANPQPAKEKHIPEWDAKFKAEREQYRLSIVGTVEDAVRSERPDGLGEYDVTQLIRAAQMWYHSPNFERFPEEDEKVRTHPIELYDGFLTVEEIERRYQLEAIHDSIARVYPDNSTDRIVDALSSLGDDTFAVQQQVLRSADQLNL